MGNSGIICVWLNVYIRTETRPEESAVLLLQEEWQAGGEGGPVGWFSGWDVSLPPWRGEMTSHLNELVVNLLTILLCFLYLSFLIIWVIQFSKLFRSLWWWPSLVWPRTLWEATTWTCCNLWVSLEPGCMVAKTLPVLDTSSLCSGQQPPYKLCIIWSCRPSAHVC